MLCLLVNSSADLGLTGRHVQSGVEESDPFDRQNLPPSLAGAAEKLEPSVAGSAGMPVSVQLIGRKWPARALFAHGRNCASYES